MEDQKAHKYYCHHCSRFLYGETLIFLVSAVNYHATAYHPSDFSKWTPAELAKSRHYAAASAPLPQYLLPHGTTSKREPELSNFDREMLEEGPYKMVTKLLIVWFGFVGFGGLCNRLYEIWRHRHDGA